MRELREDSKTKLVCLLQLGVICWFVYRAVGREASFALKGREKRSRRK